MVFLSITISCGKQDFPDYSGKSATEPRQEEERVYRSDFVLLNSYLKNSTRLEAIMWIKDIQFYARVNFMHGPAGVRFQQYIHRGSRCPQRSDDVNQDGVIDFSEVIKSSGEILIPLDGKLSSQEDGIQRFPSSNKRGNYSYSRSTAYFYMMEDLLAPDQNLRDALGKLRPDEELNLTERTIIIYGSRDNPLLPVACGQISLN